MSDAVVPQPTPGVAEEALLWPTLSVVTPSLDQARFLEATIRSILSQGYPNLEYLVIDGGSSDGSAQMIARYAHRLAYWVSEPDAGQADAVNKGWRRARGEILAYLNSDDLYLPGAFRRAVEFMEAQPEVGIIYGACQIVDAEGRAVGKPVAVPEFSLAWLLRYPLPQPTIFVRRWVVERIGVLDPTLQYLMDWEFCLRAAVAGIRIQRLAGPPVAAFRSWEGQKTAGRFERHIEEQLRIRDRLRANPQFPSHLGQALEFSKAWAFLWPAYQYYLRGEMGSARRLLHQALRLHRRIAAHPEFIGLCARTLLGRSGSQAARRLKARLCGQVFRQNGQSDD